MISATTRQPLKNIVIGLSVSENTDDLSIRGLPREEINRLILRFSQTFLAHGASLVFGHDWRPDGVMEEVYDFAVRYTSLTDEEAPQGARLANILPWPSRPSLSTSEQDSLSPILKIEPSSLPPDLSETPPNGISQTDWIIYLRARALTYARRKLNDRSQLRICAGGKTKDSSGRYFGIVEEAWLALKSEKPLFLLGVLGGASQHLINAILKLDFDESVLRPLPGMVELYGRCRPFVLDVDDDSKLESETLLNDFSKYDAGVFAQRCGLTVEDLQLAAKSWDITAALNLVLKGCLNRVSSSSAGVGTRP
jgi:hypothetical protein